MTTKTDPLLEIKTYHPEMGDAKPEADCEVRLSTAFTGKWYVTTSLELKGRGIREASTSRPGNKYLVTENALGGLIKKGITCSMAVLL